MTRVGWSGQGREGREQTSCQLEVSRKEMLVAKGLVSLESSLRQSHHVC